MQLDGDEITGGDGTGTVETPAPEVPADVARLVDEPIVQPPTVEPPAAPPEPPHVDAVIVRDGGVPWWALVLGVAVLVALGVGLVALVRRTRRERGHETHD